MTGTVQQPTVLIAESDAVISIDLEDALAQAGYRVIGPACTIAEARHLLQQAMPAAAVIDFALKDGCSGEFAQTLRQQGVPFVVYSSCRQDEQPTPEFDGAPWLCKPAHSADVIACVKDVTATTPLPNGPSQKASTAAGSPLMRKLEAFVPLSDADRATLIRVSARPHVVAAGTDLVREGEVPNGVILVLDGLAYRHKLRANGARQIVAYLVPGDVCDLDVALLDRMDHTITAFSDLRVVRIPPETVIDLLVNHPRISRALRIAQMVDEATLREWIVNIGRRSARERLAHLFCELMQRLRTVGRVSEETYDWPVTQAELADTVGLTALHVNRVLRELQRDGVIKLTRKSVTILDWVQLREIAEFGPRYLRTS